MGPFAGLSAALNTLYRFGGGPQHAGEKLISRPTDSPAGTGSAMQFRREIRRMEQYTRDAGDGLGWLGVADQTLNTAVDQVRQARDLTLRAMSAGVAGTPDDRQAVAAEIASLRDSLIGLANTTYVGRPVFGGTTAEPAAYLPDGTYQGITAGSTPLFATLDQIAAHLCAGDLEALGYDLGHLETAMNRMIFQLTDIDARYSRLEQLRELAQNRTIDLTLQLSDAEDIDLPKAITDVRLRQTAYQAALGAAARVMQPSLIDFLR